MFTRYEEFDKDSVEKAKDTVVELTRESTPQNTLDLFYSDKLDEVESGIRKLNEFSTKCWILSAIALYTIVYDNNLYQQSGLSWKDYASESRKRLGMDKYEVTEQLAGARFFIKNRDRLLKAGWTTSVPNRNLARAELAVELSGSNSQTIKHIVNDSWREFKDWYSSFKELPSATEEDKRPDIKINKKTITIGGIQAVKISDNLPEETQEEIQSYLNQIFTALKQGYFPAIVPVYDKKEASHLVQLRDKYRQGK